MTGHEQPGLTGFIQYRIMSSPILRFICVRKVRVVSPVLIQTEFKCQSYLTLLLPLLNAEVSHKVVLLTD